MQLDPLEWLLEKENPSVRRYALTDLLGLGAQDDAVLEAEREIMRTGVVPEILKLQEDPAYQQAFPRFYTYKYKGLVWSLIALAEAGATPTAPIRAQCEYLLTHSQEPRDGGFSMNAAARTGGGRISEVIPCLTGNVVWAMIRLGYPDDPRVRRGLEWLARFMRFNDGVECDPQVPPYNRYEMCWGAHTCHMGVVKALKALLAVPERDWSADMSRMVNEGVEYLLAHHIHKQSHNTRRLSKPGWLKFGFPLMYQTDVLEILDILTALGVRDDRMEEAVGVVRSKRDETGRWRAENTYGGDRSLVPFNRIGEPDKWITLRAMRVLRRYDGDPGTPGVSGSL